MATEEVGMSDAAMEHTVLRQSVRQSMKQPPQGRPSMSAVARQSVSQAGGAGLRASIHAARPSTKSETLSPKPGAAKRASLYASQFTENMVIANSISFDPETVQGVTGLNYYEERSMYYLLALNTKDIRVCYVTSEPIMQASVDYHLSLLTKTTPEEARSRLFLVACGDSKQFPALMEKLSVRPFLLDRIRRWLKSSPAPIAELKCFVSTSIEQQVSKLLGIPCAGTPPETQIWGTKEGSRTAFRDAGVKHCRGNYTSLYTALEVATAIVDLWESTQGEAKEVMVKLNEGVSGLGNARFELPELKWDEEGMDNKRRIDIVEGRLHTAALKPVDGDLGAEAFLDATKKLGSIVEEFVVRPGLTSPSGQGFISRDGEVELLSTHEQLLHEGGVFVGCIFPSQKQYRKALGEATLKVGNYLASRGCRERYAVDFISWPEDPEKPDGEWDIAAVEVNLRWGGTTHPISLMMFASGGQLSDDGVFQVQPAGSEKKEDRCYVSTDLKKPGYKGWTADDLMAFVNENEELRYNKTTFKGIIFHALGWLVYGKIGVNAYGATVEEAQEIMDKCEACLDRLAAAPPSL